MTQALSEMVGAPSELDALLQLEVVASSSSASAQGNQLSTLLTIQLVGLALLIGGGFEQQGGVYTFHRVQLNRYELHHGDKGNTESWC